VTAHDHSSTSLFKYAVLAESWHTHCKLVQNTPCRNLLQHCRCVAAADALARGATALKDKAPAEASALYGKAIHLK
jgi:hypothetical protein